MSDHKISANGLNIECHAAPDAECRTRPDCDAEGWDTSDCLGHDPGHPVTGGHDCWMLVWVDSTDLDQTYGGPGSPVTIYPGRDVVITWEGEDCSWDYVRGKEATEPVLSHEQIVQQSPTLKAAVLAGVKKGAASDAESVRSYRASRDCIISALPELRAHFENEQQKAPRRWLTTTEELEALPAGSIIRSKMGIVRERFSTGWMAIGWDRLLTSAQMAEMADGHELLHDGGTDND